MPRRAFSNAVSHQAAKYLAKPVETKPDSYPCPLLLLGIPLGGKEGKAGCYGGFEDTEKEADGYGAGEVLHSGHAAED